MENLRKWCPFFRLRGQKTPSPGLRPAPHVATAGALGSPLRLQGEDSVDGRTLRYLLPQSELRRRHGGSGILLSRPLLFVHACGTMIYAEVLAADFEFCTRNAIHPARNLHPCQPVDPDASMERNTWMDQNKAAIAQLVLTINTDHGKSKNQNKEDIPDCQKPLILSNLSGDKTSTNAQSEQIEYCLFCAGGVHEPDP